MIAKFLTLKRLRSSIACRNRDSQKRKRAKIAIPAISGTKTIGSPQPFVGCSIRAYTGSPRPTAEKAIPNQSMCLSASGSTDSRTQRCAIHIVTRISGTLTRKMARQENASTSAPPPAGPITVAMPVQAVQVPTARPRSAPSKVAARIASEPGTRSAPARPWSPRAAIRKPLLGAMPQRTEVMPKRPRPMMKIRRLPNWSPSEPPTRSNATIASR